METKLMTGAVVSLDVAVVVPRATLKVRLEEAVLFEASVAMTVKR